MAARKKKPCAPTETPESLSLETMLGVIDALKKMDVQAFACEGFQVSFKDKNSSGNVQIGFGSHNYVGDSDEDDEL